ncbi:hypothetical protein [Corynebacterium sp. SA-MJD20WY100]|uniref:hypothetical protein n=1 Tax=Corynebacterium sp. SA-MJD20WY100 TaxID=3142969 RepID=UPI003221DC91
MNQALVYRRRRLAAGAAAALLVVLGFGVFGSHGEAPVQGDQLGPDVEESREAYIARVADSPADVDEDRYALVSFTAPLTAQQTSDVLADVPRVSAMIVGAASPVPLAEPVAGATRADVFELEFGRIDTAIAGIGELKNPRTISAVVVYADGDVLRSLAARDEVVAVDAAPADAAWGSFGIRPLGSAG